MKRKGRISQRDVDILHNSHEEIVKLAKASNILNDQGHVNLRFYNDPNPVTNGTVHILADLREEGSIKDIWTLEESLQTLLESEGSKTIIIKVGTVEEIKEFRETCVARGNQECADEIDQKLECAINFSPKNELSPFKSLEEQFDKKEEDYCKKAFFKGNSESSVEKSAENRSNERLHFLIDLLTSEEKNKAFDLLFSQVLPAIRQPLAKRKCEEAGIFLPVKQQKTL